MIGRFEEWQRTRNNLNSSTRPVLLLLLIYVVMSFPSDTSPWAAPAPETSPEITVESALEKERVIKDIVTLRDGLRGLMVRITEVEGARWRGYVAR